MQHLVADVQLQRFAGGVQTRQHLPPAAFQHLLPMRYLHAFTPVPEVCWVTNSFLFGVLIWQRPTDEVVHAHHKLREVTRYT